jgi:hypothetical protein
MGPTKARTVFPAQTLARSLPGGETSRRLGPELLVLDQVYSGLPLTVSCLLPSGRVIPVIDSERLRPDRHA